MNIEQQEAHQAPPQRFLKSAINQSKKEPQIDPGKDLGQTTWRTIGYRGMESIKEVYRGKTNDVG